MQDDIFVIDAVGHSFDMSQSNFAERQYAQPVVNLIADLFATQPPGYDLAAEPVLKDWPVEDTANLLFRESGTDVAIFHPVPICFFKDGLSGFHKALEATTRWPQRFVGSYCTVDPLQPDAIGQLEQQFEQLSNPVGLKLYPIGYADGKVTPWRMDDPKIGFPLYEKAAELGLHTIAVHKSLPLGPAPNGEAFSPTDIEGAAAAFPSLTFSIVHGGISFTEEIAWLLGRFPNIWINLETLNMILAARPRIFAEIIAKMISIAGEDALRRLYWGSGAMNCHPRAGLEAFVDFEFPEEVLERSGAFFEIPQLTMEHKRAILGGNAARLYGLDIDELRRGIEGDEFSDTRWDALPTPYDTTSLAGAAMTPYPSAA